MDRIAETNNQPEINNQFDALQKILAILKELDETERTRLIQTVITFFGMTPTAHGHLSGQAKSDFLASALQSSIQPSSFSHNEVPTAKAFILDKQPKTDVERVACLGYFLTHYQNMPHFKTLNISKLNMEAAQRKFTNAAKAVDNASNYGYLVQAGQGMKQLSAVGEQFVEALPDRDAAKAALERIRPRKRIKKQQTSQE